MCTEESVHVIFNKSFELKIFEGKEDLELDELMQIQSDNLIQEAVIEMIRIKRSL